MAYSITLKMIGEIIEDYLVNELDDLDVAGSVTTIEDNKNNYIKIDLQANDKWDQNSEKLSNDIRLYLSSLFKSKPLDLYYMVKFKNLTLDIKAANNDHNRSLNVQLFYTNQRFIENEKQTNKFPVFFRNNWQIITTVVTTITLMIVTIFLLKDDENARKNFNTAVNQINIFAGIIGAFILSYVLTKALAIRQEKLGRVNTIRELSYKLTCFRKICYHIRQDHRFWDDSPSYRHGKNIASQINHDDARFPDYDNEARYALYRALIITHKHNTGIVMFYLQLYMFAGEEFENNATLAWGDYPPFKIYSNKELKGYLSFLDFDEFWNTIDNDKMKFSYSHNNFHIKPIEVAAKNYKLEGFDKPKFSEDLLLNISSDVQNKIIPELFHLTRLNEAKLPFAIIYIMWMTTALMVFSVIYPLIAAIFSDDDLISNLNVFVILGLITDIILRLPSLLQAENEIKLPDGYR